VGRLLIDSLDLPQARPQRRFESQQELRQVGDMATRAGQEKVLASNVFVDYIEASPSG
jgi:hypothetical protein